MRTTKVKQVPRGCTFTQEAWDRLPAAAQREIQRLCIEIRHAEGRVSALFDNTATDTVADPYSSAPLPLPAGTSVAFSVASHSGVKELDRHPTEIIVHTTPDGGINVNGGMSLVVSPRSTNSFTVYTGR